MGRIIKLWILDTILGVIVLAGVFAPLIVGLSISVSDNPLAFGLSFLATILGVCSGLTIAWIADRIS